MMTVVTSYGVINSTICRNSDTMLDCSYQNLSSSNLRQLFRSINTSSITSLNLSGNNLSEFITFADINQTFPKLLYLNLSNNAFREFPKYLSTLVPILSELDLSGNQLDNLHMNNFCNESDEEVGLPLLFSLNLSKNLIRTFYKKPFKVGFQNLKRLYLSQNNIDLASNDYFVGLKNLIVLDLSSNKIRDVAANFLRFSEKISYVYLDHNNLKLIWSLTFSSLSGIHLISLAHNNITKLSRMAFFYTHIYKLDLSYNPFQYLPSTAFGHSSALELDVRGTDVICNCTMQDKLVRSLYNINIYGKCREETGVRYTVEYPKRWDISDYLDDCFPCRKVQCGDYMECKVLPYKKASCVCIYGTTANKKCRPPPCKDNLCYGGSTCKNITLTEYLCFCPKEYTGKFCNISTTLPTTTTFHNQSSTTKTSGNTQIQQGKSNKDNNKQKVGTTIVISVSLVSFCGGFVGAVLIYLKMIKKSKKPMKSQYDDLTLTSNDNEATI